MLEKEKAFYAAHKAEFHEKYLHKWLIIVGESLYGTYDTPKEALDEAFKRYKPGEFIIHLPARDGLVIRIGPRISRKSPDKVSEPKPLQTMEISKDDLVTIPYASRF